MALRLTEPVDGSAAPPTPSAAITPAQALADDASAALHAWDAAAYHAAFVQAGGIEDPNRRYEAQRALLHLALNHPGDQRGVIIALAAAARAAVEMLEREAREPVILNLAGVAFYELGALAPAERLFKAAKRLDPHLPQVARNLAECARRKRAGVKMLAAAAPLIADVAPRAKRLADRAKPQRGLTLSLCMIVRDEEEMLPRCLAAVKDAVDEIVIVDTGSVDRTVEIAESFGARVIHHAWTGDFSQARNVSFEAATGDWVMYLDADEVFVEGDAARLRELTSHVWREAFFLVEINHTGDAEDGMAVTHEALRIFRNRPAYRFRDRIHEQIAYAIPSYLPERLEYTTVRMDHFGYLATVRDAKGKARRNLELLERQRDEGVDTPFLDFNLGSEYAAAGDATRALKHFRRAWEVLRADPDIRLYGFAPSCSARLLKALRIEGEHAEAIERGDEILALFPNFTDIVFEQGLSARESGDAARSKVLLEKAIAMGEAPANYSPTVGCGSYIAMAALADTEIALGDRERSEALLRKALEMHPRFLAVIDPLATAMLRRGVPASEVVEEIHGLVDEVGPSVRFLLAVALHERGAAVEAEGELRGVLQAQPHADHARLALAETLLSQSRLDDAAAVADEVADEGMVAIPAAQTAAFARLGAERLDDIDTVIARARTVEMHEAQVAALEAWTASERGGELPPTIAAEAAPLVLSMLEALLRIALYEPFGKLLPVYDAVAVPWRQRRENLAQLYFRRGYLESAADEWVTVCRQAAPDPAALSGLSAVATARGLHEDAELLATEAQALAG